MTAPNRSTRRSSGGPSLSDVLFGILCVFAMTFVALSAIALFPPKPSGRGEARRYDRNGTTIEREAARAETLRLLDIRTTIVGNMPDECRGRIAVSLPKDPPASEAAMLATVERLCPQAFEDES